VWFEECGGNVPAVVEIGGGSPAVHQTGWAVEKRNNQPGEPVRKYQREQEQAKEKAANRQRLSLEAQLPMSELIAEVAADIEAFAAELGLTIIKKVMEAEVQQKLGRWGQQPVCRHGHQPGYVIFGGRKVTLERPRLRSREDKEVGLASYQAFQRDGKLQQAVARQLTRQCSSRDYEGAIEGCLKGYGIKRSSVSRHWKAATAKELERLMQRPVPKDLLVLMIDSKFFAGDCLVAAIGVDLQGKKHILGLWHGATENATVVKGLLEDLVSRGLESERKMLIVLDGAKALRKAVQMVLGDQGLVQRCRIHKLRNVLDHLPDEKKAQAAWRLRAAWGQKDAKAAEKELRKTAQWLDGFSPMAAASLLEGLQETLTVQRLGIRHTLCRSLSNTNLIENCFAQAAYRTGRVKRWDGPRMILRWTAAALLWAEKNFRRIKGCEQLKDLQKVLHELETASTLKAA
jgi:transposase-like protein